MKLIHAATLFALAPAIFGCAANNEPIIDTKNVDMTMYEQDLTECKSYAEQVDTKTGVAKGAAGGGAVGAGVGAIAGGSISKSAGIGALLGGAKSANRATDDKNNVVKQCLRGRGYKVLN